MFSFTLFAFLSKPVIYIDGFQFYIVVSEFVSMYIDGFQFYIVVSEFVSMYIDGFQFYIVVS